MATTRHNIVISIKTEAEGDGIDATDKKTQSFSGTLKNLVAGGLLVEGGRQILAFGADAIQAASDVQEMDSKFNTVFSKVGDQVSADLDVFAKAANRSTNELKGMASTLGDTLKPMGFTEEAAGDFSVELTKLATDLSSFNDLPMDEALQRLQGTLIGSHENALAFGVIINENTLKAELAASGWDKLTGAQLEQAKVQARINLLMAGTTDAQGDAIKTADSYANQMRGLEAAFEDLSVAIGQQLLPIATEAVGLLTELTRAAKEGVDSLAGVPDQVGKISDELANKEDGPAGFEKRMQDLAIIVNEVNKTIGHSDPILDKYATGVSQARKQTSSMAAALEEASVSQQYANQHQQTAVESYEALIAQQEAAVAKQEAYTRAVDDYTTAQELSSSENLYAAAAQQTAAQSARYATQQTHALAVAAEEEAAALEAAEEAARKTAEANRALSQQSGDLFTQFSNGNATVDAGGATLLRMADAGGASAEQLALLAVATGEMSEAQATALIQQVALEQSLAALGERYADGTLSLDDYVTSAQKAVVEVQSLSLSQEGANESTRQNIEMLGLLEGAQETAGEGSGLLAGQMSAAAVSLGEVAGAADSAAKKIAEIPSETSVKIKIETEGAVPKLPGKDGGAAAYMQGGFTGYGSRSELAGFVHKNEVVVPQHVLQRGHGAIADFISKNTPGSLLPGVGQTAVSGGASTGGTPVDNRTYNIFNQSKEAAALSMAMVQERRRRSLDDYMGV